MKVIVTLYSNGQHPDIALEAATRHGPTLKHSAKEAVTRPNFLISMEFSCTIVVESPRQWHIQQLSIFVPSLLLQYRKARYTTFMNAIGVHGGFLLSL
jgi:hypothetical protein